MTANPGKLRRWPFAKSAVAFFKISFAISEWPRRASKSRTRALSAAGPSPSAGTLGRQQLAWLILELHRVRFPTHGCLLLRRRLSRRRIGAPTIRGEDHALRIFVAEVRYYLVPLFRLMLLLARNKGLSSNELKGRFFSPVSRSITWRTHRSRLHPAHQSKPLKRGYGPPKCVVPGGMHERGACFYLTSQCRGSGTGATARPNKHVAVGRRKCDSSR